MVLRSMCQCVLLLGHYRVLKAAQVKSGVTMLCIIISGDVYMYIPLETSDMLRFLYIYIYVHSVCTCMPSCVCNTQSMCMSTHSFVF